MSRKPKRWPIWKIAVTTAVCAVSCPVLFWLSTLAETTGDQTPDSTARTAVITLPTVVMMFGMIAGMLAVLSLIWLILRIRDARIPAWKKRAKKLRF